MTDFALITICGTVCLISLICWWNVNRTLAQNRKERAQYADSIRQASADLHTALIEWRAGTAAQQHHLNGSATTGLLQRKTRPKGGTPTP